MLPSIALPCFDDGIIGEWNRNGIEKFRKLLKLSNFSLFSVDYKRSTRLDKRDDVRSGRGVGNGFAEFRDRQEKIPISVSRAGHRLCCFFVFRPAFNKCFPVEFSAETKRSSNLSTGTRRPNKIRARVAIYQQWPKALKNQLPSAEKQRETPQHFYSGP